MTGSRLLGFSIIAVLAAGCGSSADDISEARLAQMAGGELKDVIPVSGNVLVDGVPQGGVNIYLYASTGGKVIATCRTDVDGSYCWTTHTACDGVEAGSYRLAFQYLPKLKRNDKGQDVFQGRYSDPMTVEFLLNVEPGAPQADVNYELTTK